MGSSLTEPMTAIQASEIEYVDVIVIGGGIAGVAIAACEQAIADGNTDGVVKRFILPTRIAA